ncbi:TonB-dependent siderophore receptor [Pigmentiphaga humi]|uniref:TonB-dependent siderophore receptor n=1 Tax=Pigmentiphaga humi TaxID=2478468 RepID=UPI000F541802|nr:TonB-dependent receptor [Pigmentiphaga humi]
MALAVVPLALAACAPAVSLHEPASASAVPAGPPARQEPAPPEPELPYTSVALVYPVADATGAPASPRAPAVPGWIPDADGGIDGRTGLQAYNQATPGTKSNYEFEQKLDDTWMVKQSLRYDGPQNQPGAAGRPDGASVESDGLGSGLGTFNVGTYAQARFTTAGLQHSFKFGFDYLKSRDIYESRIAPAPSLDIFDAGYGTHIGQPRIMARSYAEESKLGFFVQDEVQYQRWVLSMVGRRDQGMRRTVDLNTAGDEADAAQDDVYSGRLGLRYQFPIGLSPYVNYSQSYAPRAGDAAWATSQQYETGVRYQPPLLGQLMTVTAFNQIQNNAQASNAQEGCAAAGCSAWAEMRIRGTTVESKLQPLQNMNLVATYALTRSTVLHASDDAYAAMLANRYPDVSEQRLSLGANYAVTRGWFAGLSLDGRVGRAGAYYGGAASGMAVSYTLLDAGVNYDFARLDSSLKGLKLRASANNMLDQEYASYCYTDACTAGARRSVSAILNYQVAWP